MWWPEALRHLVQAQMRTRALKQRINDLRRERLVFNDLLRKLGSSLQASRCSVVQALKSVHHANLARERVRPDWLPPSWHWPVAPTGRDACAAAARVPA